MAVVAFNLAAFRLRYPEFAAVGDAVIIDLFSEAGLYVSNSDSSPISDLVVRARVLNMVTAHLTAMNFGVNGEAASPLVGRIEGAAEGSVNVKMAYAASSGTKAWYDQTKYGAAAWAALAPFRTFQYRAPADTGRSWP